MADLKSSSTAGGSLVWTQTNLPVSPQDEKIFYKNMELVDSKNNQTIAGKKDFTTGATVPTPVAANDAANKSYVDGKDATSVKSVRGTAPIKVTAGVAPIVSIDAATPSAAGSMSAADKAKLDNHPMNVVNKTGDNMTGSLTTTGEMVADGMIESKAFISTIRPDGAYGSRLSVNTSGVTYLQGGKTDRGADDQKMWMSGYLGTPLSEYIIAMKAGVQPQVRLGQTNYDILHRGNMPTVADINAMGYFLPTSVDCDLSVEPGQYKVSNQTLNMPITPAAGSTFITTKWDVNSGQQIFFATHLDRVWVRRRSGNVWRPWFEFYSTSNEQDTGGMGYGVGNSPNALTATGGVRDFNLIKKNGVYTTDGTWLNNVDNGTTATSAAGVIHVYQRSYDDVTVQRFIGGSALWGVSLPKEYVRSWSPITGWGPWFSSGVWDNVNLSRSGTIRHNSPTDDDSSRPVYMLAKENYRPSQPVNGFYAIGDYGFSVGMKNRYDAHSGDNIGYIRGEVANTDVPGSYIGRISITSRSINPDGTTTPDSYFWLDKNDGARFTHGSRMVYIKTGQISADEFLQNTAQSSVGNSSTRKDYVDGELAKRVAKTGDTMTGTLVVPSSRGMRTETNASNGQYAAISSESTYAMMWRMNSSATKADEFIGIDQNSNLTFRQDKGLGDKSYSDFHVYHVGNKPSPGTLGAVSITGDTMTGNLYIDRGASGSEVQMGVNRTGRKLYMYDNGNEQGIYSVIGGSFVNTRLVSRNVNDGTISFGNSAVGTIIYGAGNLKHGSADVYTTSNRPSPSDINAVPQSDVSSNGASGLMINKIPKLSGEVLEIARYIDMHTTGSTLDYDTRLESHTDGTFKISIQGVGTRLTIGATESLFNGDLKVNGGVRAVNPVFGLSAEDASWGGGIKYQSGGWFNFYGGRSNSSLTEQRISMTGYNDTPLNSFRVRMEQGKNPTVLWGGTAYDILHRGNMPTVEDLGAVAKIGDTMVGDLNVASPTGNSNLVVSSIVGKEASLLLRTGTFARWKIFSDSAAETGNNAGSNFRIVAYNDDGSLAGQVLSVPRNDQRITMTKMPLTSEAQVAQAGALTRYDFVTGELAKKSDTTYVNTELGKKSDTTYVNTELGKKLNLSGGTMTGGLTLVGTNNALVVGNSAKIKLYEGNGLHYTIDADATNFKISSGVDGETPLFYLNNNVTVSNRKAVIVSDDDGLTLQSSSSTAASYIKCSAAGVRKWYLGKGSSSNDVEWVSDGHNVRITLRAGGASVAGSLDVSTQITEAGARVYSSRNEPNYTHLHTAAQGNYDVLTGTGYPIGSYIFAQKTTGPAFGPGQLAEGSALRPASAGDYFANNQPLPGGWKCMGYALTNNEPVDARSTLWIRIS